MPAGHAKKHSSPYRLRALRFALAVAIPVLLTPQSAVMAHENGTHTASIGEWGLDPASFAKDIRPADDIYGFVNKHWLETVKVPADAKGMSSAIALRSQSRQRRVEIIAKILASPSDEDPDIRNIQKLYSSYIDQETQNRLGMEPVRAELNSILQAPDHDQISRLMARPFLPTLFDLSVEVDGKNANRYILNISPAKLTLPSREYYLGNDPRYVEARDKYENYIATILDKAGISDAATRARDVLALETGIAQAYWSASDVRDIDKMHHGADLTSLSEYAPGIDWATYLEEAGFSDQTSFNLQMDSAIRSIAALFSNNSSDQWALFLAYRMIERMSPYLSDDWQELHFDFHHRFLTGQVKRTPVGLRAVEFISFNPGLYKDGFGRFFAEQYFSDAERQHIAEIFGYVQRAFRKRVSTLDWMDETTRQEALAKIDSMTLLAGYSDTRTDYSDVMIDPTDLVGNMRRLAEAERAHAIAQLDEPRRDNEFPYPPQRVYGLYNPSYNRVSITASFLQSPIYDQHADIAVNFGAIGAMIGHSMAHGIDSEGQKYDHSGALRLWASNASRQAFEHRSQQVLQNMSRFYPDEIAQASARQTLGEDLTDLAGLTVAYDAYKLYVEEKTGGTENVIDGFTGSQRFFLSWAQIWRNKVVPNKEPAIGIYSGGRPSQGPIRVNGLFQNIDAWYDAFNVSPDDELYLAPEERVRIW